MSNKFTAHIGLDTQDASKNVASLSGHVESLTKSLEELNKVITASKGDLSAISKSIGEISKTSAEGARAARELNKARVEESKVSVNVARAKKEESEANIKAAKAKEIEAEAALKNAKAGTEEAKQAREIEQAKSAAARTAEINARTSARANREVATEARQVSAAQREAARSTNDLGFSLASHRYLMYDVGATYRSISIALLAVPAASSAAAISFEKDFAQVIRTTGLADESARKFHRELKDMSSQLPITFSELAEIGKIGGQMGIANKQLSDFTETVAKFVRTSEGLDNDRAANAFGRLNNLFNQKADGTLADEMFFRRIGSAISYTADNAVTSEKQIIEMLRNVGASAKAVGLDIKETIAISSALSSVGVQPYLASGFTVRFFGNFTSAAAEGGKKAEEFARSLKMTNDEFQNAVRNDPHAILRRVAEEMRGMDSVAQNKFLARLGIDGVQDPKVLNALSGNLHVLDKAMQDVNQAYGEATYLDESSHGIFNTTAAQAQKLIQSFMSLGETISRNNLPVFGDLINTLSKTVNVIDRLIDSNGATRFFAGLFTAVMGGIGALYAFRAATSFVNASLVMFQDAARKGAMGTRTFGTTTEQLAKAILYSKGANDQHVQSMLAGKSAMAQLTTAINAQRSALQGTTAARKSDIGALQANAAAASAAASSTNTLTTATTASAAAQTGFRGALTSTGTAVKSFGGFLGRSATSLAGLLNPMTIGATAVLGLGMAFVSAKADSEQFNTDLYKLAKSADNTKESIEGLSKSLANEEVGFWESLFDSIGSSGGLSNVNKTMLEIYNTAGLTTEEYRKHANMGEKGLRILQEQLRTQLDSLKAEQARKGIVGDMLFTNKSFNDDIAEIDALEKSLKSLENQIKTAKREQAIDDDIKKNAGEAAEGVDELSDSFEGAADAAGNFDKAVKEALDAVFGFINAEAGMNSALEKFGEGLHNAVDMSSSTAEGIQNVQNFQSVVSNAMSKLRADLQEGTYSSAEEARQAYTAMFNGLEQQMNSMGVDPQQAAEMTSKAIESIEMVLGNTELTAQLSVDSENAQNEVIHVMDWVSSVTETYPFELKLDADGQPASENTAATVNWIAQVMGLTPEAVLDAIDGTATENTAAIAKFIYDILQQDYTAYVNANTSAGKSNVKGFADWAHGELAKINSGIASAGSELNNLVDTAAMNSDLFGSAKLWGFVPRNTPNYVMQASAAPKDVDSRPTFTQPKLKTAPAIKQPKQEKIKPIDLSPLSAGYDKAAKAAERAGGAGNKAGKGAKKAGDAGKKAGKDAAKGAKEAEKAVKEWNAQYQDLSGWASRVGEALKFAFDQKHNVQAAKDEYYSILNGIEEKLKNQKKQVQDLIQANRTLRAERQVDLNDAKKFEEISKIALKHGNVQAAKEYADQAKAMRESAAEKQNQIKANDAERASIQKGIGNLKGYSQAAIDNRNDLRQLEQAALKVPEAYASVGASAKKVKEETERWTSRVKTHGRQLINSGKDVDSFVGKTKNYVKELGKVPRTITSSVNAKIGKTADANRALNNVAKNRNSSMGASSPYAKRKGAMSALNNTAKNRTSTVTAKANTAAAKRLIDRLAYNRSFTITAKLKAFDVYKKKNLPFDNWMVSGWNLGGIVPAQYNQGGKVLTKFNTGGLIPGRAPDNPRADNMLASVDDSGLIAVRSREYIVSQPAVDYYGQNFMDKLNQKKLPKYNMGGLIGQSKTNIDSISPIDLSADSIRKIAQALSVNVGLRVGNEQLAAANNKGLRIQDQKRGKF